MHQGLEVGEGKYSRVFLSTPWWVCFLFWYFLFFCCFPGISVVGGLVSSSGANLDAW